MFNSSVLVQKLPEKDVQVKKEISEPDKFSFSSGWNIPLDKVTIIPTRKRKNDSFIEGPFVKRTKDSSCVTQDWPITYSSDSLTTSKEKDQDNDALISCVRESAKNAKDELSAWKLFFSPVMLDMIVNETNKEIKEMQLVDSSCSDADKNHDVTNHQEILAYIGLHYFRGLFNQNYQSVKTLYTTTVGHPIYGATMSRIRYQFLQAHVKFEDSRKTRDMWEKDTFSAFRNFFRHFNDNCARHIEPFKFLSMNELLYPMSDSYRFFQMPLENPSKYGLVFNSLTSPHHQYTFISHVVIGKSSLTPESGDETEPAIKPLVIQLQKHSSLRGKQITLDHANTNTSIADWLLKRGINCIGPMTSDHEELPESLREMKCIPDQSYKTVVFDSNPAVTFNSYIVQNEKEKSNNFLLSTMKNEDLPKTSEEKPRLYELYYKTKANREVVDQQLNSFTTRSESKRWTATALSYVLDVCRVNACILLALNNGKDPRTVDYLDFSYKLLSDLVKPYIESRRKHGLNRTIMQKIKIVMGSAFKLNSITNNEDGKKNTSSKASKGRRCSVCVSLLTKSERKRKDIPKLKKQCQRCGKAVCSIHFVQYCPQCFSEEVEPHQ